MSWLDTSSYCSPCAPPCFCGVQVALAEADSILGGLGLATQWYLSFALLPEGFPLPPPALEEFWRSEDGGAGNARVANSSLSASNHEPGAVEVLEALRLLGRAGGGESAAGVAPHGIQRRLVLVMSEDHPDIMDKLLRRRVWVLSRISSLVGTFDDECWALGGGGDGYVTAGAKTGGGGAGVGGPGGRGARRDSWLPNGEVAESDVDIIPASLLGSGPGPPSHGYGGFSRYDYLVASWEALPGGHTLTAAATGYLESVRAACKAVQHSGGGGVGGWAAARALAAAADVQALADRGSEAIPAYEEACRLLAAEAERSAQAGGVSQWKGAARDSLHKMAIMVQDLALFTGHVRKEAAAIRLLQRSVEIHLSVLAASGCLVPDIGESALHGQQKTPASGSMGADREVEEAAQLLEVTKGRGAGISWRAVANDDRPLRIRLRLQPMEGGGEPAPAGRGGGGGGGASGGTLPLFGTLDVAATCVADLGRVVSCTRQLRQAKRVDESVQLAEKVYPVLKEILGAEHAFTKAALAGFVGQGIVDECWSQQGAGALDLDDALGPGQHPTLPSPTSHRKLARNNESRAPLGVPGSAEKKGASSSASAKSSSLAALSSPPSPLPPEFYSRPTSAVSAPPSAGAQALGTPNPHPSSAMAPQGGTGDWRPYHHHYHGSGRQGFSFGVGSSSSGSEADDGDESDGLPRGVGALRAPRRGGRVGRGFPPNSKRSLDRQLQGWQREAHPAWNRREPPPPFGMAAAAGVGRDALHPASTLMQHDRYIRHLIRRARAHAFLVTAATRARLKDAHRAKAGLFLLDRARQAGATMSGGVSPEGGGPQMPRLTAAWNR